MVWLQVATTVLLFFIGLAVSAIVWYLRRYVISEVEKNSQVRRWLTGEDGLARSDGYAEEVDSRFDQLRTDMHQQHAQVDRKLERFRLVLERVVELLEDEHDANIDAPAEEKWADD